MELRVGSVVQTAGRMIGYYDHIEDSFFFPAGTLLTITRLEENTGGGADIFRAEPFDGGPGYTYLRMWQFPKQFEEPPPLVVIALAADD